jgi:septal ring factor EnvC (AmiA/AmiB activator)
MKTRIIAAILVLAASAVAFLQFSAAMQLRQELAQFEAQLAQSEAERAGLEQQVAANVVQQELFRQQIANLRENLQSSTAQLGILSSSLQEAREMVQDNATENQPEPTATQ